MRTLPATPEGVRVQPQLVIEVECGVVQRIYAGANCKVTVVDLDEIEKGETATVYPVSQMSAMSDKLKTAVKGAE